MSPISIHEFLKPYELLFLEFESFIKGKIWIVNKSLSNFICHLSWLRKPSPTHIHSWIFKTLWVIMFWVWVIHKWLNANWENIDSLILSLTFHGLGNFPPIIHIPSYPFVNFQNPMSGVGWVIKGWCGSYRDGAVWVGVGHAGVG